LEARLGGLEIIELPTLYERFTGRVPVELVEDQWLLSADGFHLLFREYMQRVKRILDFSVSGVLLLFCAPLMALTALAIALESPGRVFYSQDRVGLGGKVFRVYKFRSMRFDAEAGGVQWAQKHDARITRVGRWIRVFRIDELPQLWNIFKGDMSVVGPRPERPEFVHELETAIPYYSARHTVRPGLTGWAQVNFPYGASVEDSLRKLEYDLYYVKNMSIFLDFQILLKTVGVVLLGEGAR
jgi:exopolysaccharide biosynthesis polyprenyl glycosylphosphotransferase